MGRRELRNWSLRECLTQHIFNGRDTTWRDRLLSRTAKLKFWISYGMESRTGILAHAWRSAWRPSRLIGRTWWRNCACRIPPNCWKPPLKKGSFGWDAAQSDWNGLANQTAYCRPGRPGILQTRAMTHA